MVALGLLFALKGTGTRAFYRWANRDLRPLFPRLPERTRLLRLFAAHHDWTRLFLETPTVLGLCDSYGIELVHPMREGHSKKQMGRKGLSNHRWIVGVKLALVLNQWGLVVDWDTKTANVLDQSFHPLIKQFEVEMIVFTDTGFHAKDGDPANMKVCARGTRNDRMTIETVLSLLHGVCRIKKVVHRLWEHLKARLAFALAAFALAAFNICTQWNGFPMDEEGCIHLSMANFTL